jgi:hypothetical protein
MHSCVSLPGKVSGTAWYRIFRITYLNKQLPRPRLWGQLKTKGKSSSCVPEILYFSLNPCPVHPPDVPLSLHPHPHPFLISTLNS